MYNTWHWNWDIGCSNMQYSCPDILHKIKIKVWLLKPLKNSIHITKEWTQKSYIRKDGAIIPLYAWACAPTPLFGYKSWKFIGKALLYSSVYRTICLPFKIPDHPQLCFLMQFIGYRILLLSIRIWILSVC